MKTKKTTLMMVLLLFAVMGTEAQFFKKLKERAKEAAEETVMRKTAEKAAQETDKAMDKVFDMDFGKKGSQVNPAILPESYAFDWKYSLKMQHKKGDMLFHYHLSETADHFASKPEMEGMEAMGGMLMVIDPQIDVTAILFDRNGEKTGQVVSMPKEMTYVANSEEQPNYTFKEIGTKEILGYECQGYEIETDDYTMVMYTLMDAPISFSGFAQGNVKGMPKDFDPKLLKQMENSLMMELQMIHKKKKKFNATMTCVSLKEEPMQIDVSEYDFNFQKALQGQEVYEEDY